MKVWIKNLILSSPMIWGTLAFTPLGVASTGLDQSGVSVHIERLGGMAHFEFQGQKEWVYNLKREGKKLHLTLPKLSHKSIEKIRTFNNLLVEKTQVSNKYPNKSKISIHLRDSRVESFNYLTQQPNQLILDLFVENNSILADIRKKKQTLHLAKKANKNKRKNKKRIKKSVAQKKISPDRKPAFAEFFALEGEEKVTPLPLEPIYKTEELYELGDFVGDTFNSEDLESSVIEAGGNIYLRFPLLKVENKHLKELQHFTPEYEIQKSFSDENKQARVLLKLFKQRSFASFIKAKRIFRKIFPQTKYNEILNYMEADTWVELWKISKKSEYLTKAMNIYRMLIERHPNSKIAERTLIQAGLLANDVGEYFVATKMLRRYLKLYRDSPFTNHIKIYIADSLAHLNNYDQSRKIFKEVIKNGEKDTTAEASYRLGDIYFLKQSFRRAEGVYNEALEKFPHYAHRFPNAIFNKAEALFHLAEYPNSLKTYKEFSKKFPSHPYTGYALTRIGELIDLLKHNKKMSQGFYNESFFRFRKTTGGTLARIRSLSQRFKYMEEEELRVSIKEIYDHAKAVNLPQVNEFAAFMISDGYYDRGDYLKAAEALISYFQIDPKPVNIRKFEKRISRAIAGEVKKLLQQKEPLASLKIIENHQKSWLSASRRLDVQYFRALAYEKMKLYNEASESYDRVVQRMNSLSGTKEEKERKVFEYYPTFDQLRVRQALVKYNIQKKKEASLLIDKVKNIDNLDMKSKFDFYFTKAKLLFDEKKYAEAIENMKLLEKSKITDSDQEEKFNMFLSEIYEKNNQFDKAITILEEFHKKSKNTADQIYVLSRLFQLYRNKDMKGKAIEAGKTLLEKYEENYNLDRQRYYLGELFFNQNNHKEAQKWWKGLEKKSMWEKLAQNKKIASRWKEEQENKINRIPAMAK